MTKQLLSRIRNKYDSAARWKRINPVLLEGEFGVDEYGRIKVGDGQSGWNSLPYVMESFRLEPVESSSYQNGTVPVSPLSDQIVYVIAKDDVVLDFEKVYRDETVDKLYFTQKKIYIENDAGKEISLSIQNAEWANDLNAPDWGMPGMHLYILATWIGGRIILEIIDNDQAADNIIEP